MLRTQKITGTLTFLARNIEGRMETWAADGGKYYQLTDIPGMGKQEEGSDGVIAWDRSPAIGPRVKPRKSTATLGVTLDAAGMIEWRALIDRVRTEALKSGSTGANVTGCALCRAMVRRISMRWYDRDTGLLYRSAMAMQDRYGRVADRDDVRGIPHASQTSSGRRAFASPRRDRTRCSPPTK